MKIMATALPEVFIIEPRVFHDERGYFFEGYQEKRYREQGIPESFVQDNVSYSRKNVIRGLHYQLIHPQGKLVFVAKGKVLDVIVDVRQGSPQFGQFITVELCSETQRQVYIPPGFAHGFCVLSEEAYFIYKCTDYYHPAGERGVHWRDSQLKISWPVTEAVVSAKDDALPLLQEITADQLPPYSL